MTKRVTMSSKIGLLEYLIDNVTFQQDEEEGWVNGTCGMVRKYLDYPKTTTRLMSWYEDQRPSETNHKKYYNMFLGRLDEIEDVYGCEAGETYAYWFNDNYEGNEMRIKFLNYLLNKVNKGKL